MSPFLITATELLFLLLKIQFDPLTSLVQAVVAEDVHAVDQIETIALVVVEEAAVAMNPRDHFLGLKRF